MEHISAKWTMKNTVEANGNVILSGNKGKTSILKLMNGLNSSMWTEGRINKLVC